MAILRAVRAKIRAWIKREIPSLGHHERRGNPDEGLPDPAAALDRFEGWLEARLPPEPRPAWATGVLWTARLVVGRGSWVLGAALVAMSAPFWVFPYRQIESMALASWYRLTATATAEARIETMGLRLVPDSAEGLRGEPYVVLAFEPQAGASTVRVRYLPHGAGLESFHQVYIDEDLFSMPREYSLGFRPRWRDPATGEPRVELAYRSEDAAAVESLAGWNQKTQLANAERSVDRPLEWFLGDWLRAAEDGASVTVRFPPGRPQRVFASDVLSRLPPTGGSPWGALLTSLLICVPFALPFWWAGTRLLARPLPPRWRHVVVWGPLALLPFWGTRYVEAVERLSPEGAEFNPVARKMGSTQVLPGAEPLEALSGPRIVFDLDKSRFAPLLRRVDLRRPADPLPDHDAVWRELSARFNRAVGALPDDELSAMLNVAWHDFGDVSMSPVLIDTARRVTVEPSRSEALREEARRYLLAILETSWPQLCEPAFAARWDELAPLAAHPDPEIAAAAEASIAKHLSWSLERDADGRPRCGS